MSRQPIHTLVIPYRLTDTNTLEFALFQRPPGPLGEFWQWISGGVEGQETLLETAKREAQEEAGIDPVSEFIQLDSMTTIPAEFTTGMLWGPDVLLVKEYCFAVQLPQAFQIKLSDEHQAFEWLSYEGAFDRLKFDSNKNALWELNYRLNNKPIPN